MLLFHNQSELKIYLHSARLSGQSIGFVPTMGALHLGHISLVRQSFDENDLTVCSIFVNPTQFNDAVDLAKYPRTIEADTKLLLESGCDILYLPTPTDVYSGTAVISERFDFNGIDNRLEGASRPGHFAGVAQVVKLLLEITEPDKMYMGQKDFQQWLIVRRMVELLQKPVSVVRCPIFREKNGLAMSSRNARLSEVAKNNAAIIYATLQWASTQLPKQQMHAIEVEAMLRINKMPNFHSDYFEVLKADSLQPMRVFNPKESIVIVTAVLVEGVRLLDNLLIEAS